MVNNLKEQGYRSIELLTYANLNHALADGDGVNHISDVLNDTKGWLNRVLTSEP